MLEDFDKAGVDSSSSSEGEEEYILDDVLVRDEEMKARRGTI